MTALSIGLLVLIVLVALWLVVEPLRRGAGGDPDAGERERLHAERDRLYGELAALDDTSPRRPDLERRAALTLRALDELPPSPGPRPGRRPALIALALALGLTVAGAVTLVPRWQLASLDPREAKNVQAALALPGLKARAERSRAVGDYLAWGRAAFDSGRYGEAVPAYASALKQDPRQPEALRRLGIVLLTRPEVAGRGATPADAQQAALLIRSAAQLAPNEPESQLLLGFALARFGDEQNALTALERYRTLNPSGRDADELITAIRSRQQQGDPGQAVYAANCASCHGPGGGGGALGPSLRESRLTRDALRQVIVQGKGAMPAYPNLKATELNALLDLLERWQKDSGGA